MEIQDFGRTRLLNNQHLAASQEFEALILEKGADTLDVADLFSQYQAAIKIEADGMMKVVKSSFTADMEVGDKDRDELFIGSTDTIRNAKRHFKPEKKAAGNRLAVLLTTYQGSDSAGFDDETGRIRNFIQEIRSEKYKADADLIGLTEWMEPLEKANELCAQLADRRNTEQRNKDMTGQIKKLRLDTDAIYKKLVKRINSLTDINGDEKYADLITRWNTRIDHYRVSVSQRLGAGKGGSTGKGDNTPTPAPPSGGGEEERPGEL